MKIYQKIQIIGLIFTCVSCSTKPEIKAPVYAISVTQPIQKDSALYQEYVGHIEAYTSVEVTSQIEGILMAQHFEEGSEVKKGDLLFTIDPRPYVAQVENAEAMLAQDKANLRYAENTAQRYSKLIQEEYVSKLNYEQYLTNVVLAEAKVKGDIANLDIAKLNLDYCYIRAPMDAVAGNVDIHVGNLIPNAGTTPLVLLNQILPIYVSFYIPEKDLPKIRSLQTQKGLETQVFLNQDRTHPFTGYLSIINNQVDASTGTILMKSTFANKDRSLWPGEFVDVRLILGEAKNAILLPSQAVQIGPNNHYVYIVRDDNTVEMRPVKIGQREDNYIIIEQGLKMGETVVLEGQVNLYEGAQVAIKKPVT